MYSPKISKIYEAEYSDNDINEAKVVVIGSKNCGKTSIVGRIISHV